MPLSALRSGLSEGFVLSGWSSLTDPVVHEALLRGGLDAITFDVQHGLHDAASLAAGIARAVSLGKPSLVRLPVEGRALAARALDFGASGVIMPMIESAAQAQAFVSVAKYPPLGLRSFGPLRAPDLHGYASSDDYAAAANAETLTFAMIETRKALDELDAILAIGGLDGVFVGPSDLSIALSSQSRRDVGNDQTLATIRSVAEAARTAGKFAGIYAIDAADARAYRDFGYHFVCVASDLLILRAGAASLVKAIAR